LLIYSFLSQSPQETGNVEEVAKLLAERAKILNEQLKTQLLKQKGETTTQDTLWILYNSFRENVYLELTPEQFADSFTQTLVYGLFIAKFNNHKKEKITLKNVEEFVPTSFALVRNILFNLSFLTKKHYEKSLWIVVEILHIINHIDLKVLQENMRFKKNSSETLDEEYKDPYIYFYEHFLAAYNPALRKSRGVYYTPNSIVKFIVTAIDDILQDKQIFNIPQGIADPNKVTVLDFATGTGTFLLEIIEQINEKKPFNKPEGNKLVKNHVLKNLYGFEYLIAPYTIAHLKLSQYLKENGYEMQDENEDGTGDRLQIYLTNTLEYLKPNFTPLVPQLAEEGKKAQTIKEGNILVICGNPPYAGHSSNESETKYQEQKMYKNGKIRLVNRKKNTRIGDLLHGKIKENKVSIQSYFECDGKDLGEKNSKWLQDDYVKFIAFSQYKIARVGEGILAVVTNHGFLDNPTFRGMRQSLLKTFDVLYFIDLHGNVRKKEKSPDGTKDENLFDIQQGVCIAIFIKNDKIPKNKSGLGTVYRSDFWGDRKTKKKLCETENLQTVDFQKLSPSSPYHLFVYQDEINKKEYEKGWKVTDIFTTYSVGVVTARDALAIHLSEEKLLKTIQDFANLSEVEAREKYKLGLDTRDWKVSFAQADLKQNFIANKPDKTKVTKIAYRPFDIRYTYYTGKTKGFHCMPRKEVMQYLLDNELNIALTTSRNLQKQGAFCDVLVSKYITDLHYSSVGTYCFPLYRHEYIAENKKNKQKKLEYGTDKEHLAIENEYLAAKIFYKQKLRENINDFDLEESRTLFEELTSIYEKSKARIYINSHSSINKVTVKQIKKVENDVAILENINSNFREFINQKYAVEYTPEQILAYCYAILHSPTYRETYNEILKIDFPKILFVETAQEFEKLASLGTDLIALHLQKEEIPNRLKVSFEGEISTHADLIERVEFRRVGEKYRLYINATNYFENISPEIFSFQIGGYKVIEKYLKERKDTKLETAEINQVYQIANILAETMRLMNEIEEILLIFAVD
jgi:predicted helicase